MIGRKLEIQAWPASRIKWSSSRAPWSRMLCQRRGVVRRFSRLLHRLVDIQTVPAAKECGRREVCGFPETHFLQLAHSLRMVAEEENKRMPLGQCLGADWLCGYNRR